MRLSVLYALYDMGDAYTGLAPGTAVAPRDRPRNLARHGKTSGDRPKDLARHRRSSRDMPKDLARHGKDTG
jgi:hypothetical protein